MVYILYPTEHKLKKLYFPAYPKSLTPFDSKRSILWHFYVASNNINVLTSLLKESDILVRFQRSFNFLGRFEYKSQISNFHENTFSGRRVAACGQTDGQMEGQTPRR